MIPDPGFKFPQPDWVMCGVPNWGGGVRLIASQELSHAELKTQVESPENWRTDLSRDPSAVRKRFVLTAEMKTMTVIDAPDYPSAFKSLFEAWSPEPVARPAIGIGQQEIQA